MLSQNTIERVQATLPLLESAQEAVTQHFYNRMFRDNPEFKEIFNLAHQASGAQPVALFNAVLGYAKNLHQPQVLATVVTRIAHKHTSFGIQPDQYALVGHHLLETLRELGGDAVDQATLDAWAEAYQQLADLFIGVEEGIYQSQEDCTGGWRGTRTFVVSDKAAEGAQISRFEFTPADGQPVADFAPGQYLGIYLKPAEFEHQEIRQYSLSAASNGRSYRIAVKREGAGLASNYLHDKLNVGDQVELAAPAGDFTLNSPAQRNVTLISAGVGITPMLAMLHARTQAPAQTHFLHISRNSTARPFADEINALLAEHPQLRATTWLSQPLDDDIENEACNRVGRMQLADIEAELDVKAGDFYLCGPVEFMRDIKQQLIELGVADDRIHYEVFGPHQGL